MKGLTITMKIEVDSQDIPPNQLKEMGLRDLRQWARNMKYKMEADFSRDIELAPYATISVEVEENP